MYILNALRSYRNKLLVRVNPGREGKKWKELNEIVIENDWLQNRNTLDIDLFLESILGVNFDSLLEVGSSCGNKIYNLAIKHRNKVFLGVDINPNAIKVGNNYCKEKKIHNLSFKQFDITKNLEFLNEEKFDVVLVWATLIYVHPIHIKKALINIRNLAKFKIVLIEQNDPDILTWPKYLGYQIAGGPNWARNYKKILLSIFPDLSDKNIYYSPIPENIWAPGGGKGQCLIVDLHKLQI